MDGFCVNGTKKSLAVVEYVNVPHCSILPSIYFKLSDGKIEQWGHSTTQTSTSTVLTYLVPFSSATSYSISGNDVYDDEVAANLQMYNKTASSCKVFRQNRASTNWDWRAVGY